MGVRRGGRGARDCEYKLLMNEHMLRVGCGDWIECNEAQTTMGFITTQAQVRSERNLSLISQTGLMLG